MAQYLSNRKDRQIFYATASFENAEDLGLGKVHTLEDRNRVVHITVKPVLANPKAA